jgi:hypothetical protein
MIVGAAFAHNFALAGGADSVVDGAYKVGGIGPNGQIVAICCLVALLIISVTNLKAGD